MFNLKTFLLEITSLTLYMAILVSPTHAQVKSTEETKTTQNINKLATKAEAKALFD